jgi:RNase P subunit RPR2
MKNESSLSQVDLQDRLRLLEAEAAGDLDELLCPKCRKCTVSVWFTHPSKQEYRTWFVCDNCDFSMRAQNVGRPSHYSKERDRTERKKGSKLSTGA